MGFFGIFEIFWDVLGFFGIFLGFIEIPEIRDFWDFLRFFGIFRDFLGFFWDFLGKCTRFFRVIYPSSFSKNVTLVKSLSIKKLSVKIIRRQKVTNFLTSDEIFDK